MFLGETESPVALGAAQVKSRYVLESIPQQSTSHLLDIWGAGMRTGVYGAQTLILVLVIVPKGKHTSLPDNVEGRERLLCQGVFPGVSW